MIRNKQAWSLTALTLAGVFGLTRLPVWSQQPPLHGLEIKLSAGNSAAPEVMESTPTGSVSPLSPAATGPIFQRVAPLTPLPNDQKDFALREGSLPAPKTGTVVQKPFPVQQTAVKPEVKIHPLEVLKFGPEGAVDIAPHLQVTFNQPMVPITSTEELARRPVPIHMSPSPKGRWRWLGVNTAAFTPEATGRADRFAMASSYTVEIPAGTRSQTGGKLAKAVRWSFHTPTVLMTDSVPTGSSTQLKAVVVLVFNQNINPAAVLATTTLLDAKGHSVPIRMATPDEIANDPGAHLTVRNTRKGRYLAIVARQPFSRDSEYKVHLAAGTASAEGPLRTPTAQSFRFHTYSALKLTDSTHDSVPGSAWQISFNNSLNPKRFRPESVHIEPELPGRKVTLSGDAIQIEGRSQGRTKYRVTVPAGLVDVFGQTLQQPVTVNVSVGSSAANFEGPSKDFVILDPLGPRNLNCGVVNYKSLHVRAYRVGPKDWDSYRFFQLNNRNNAKGTTPPGQLVWTGDVPVKQATDSFGEVKVDLTPALPKKFGQLLVIVEPREPIGEHYDQQWVGWVQSTQIGLDAMIDGKQVVAWANQLKDGAPLSGVQVHLEPSGESLVTDTSGLAHLKLLAPAQLLVARRGDDEAVLPYSVNQWDSGSWTPSVETDALLWYVMDDRHMYRPGEKVEIKGWVRTEQRKPHGGLVLSGAGPLTYILNDSRGNKIGEGTAKIGALGGFHFQLELPKTVNLGSCQVEMSTSEGTSNYSFEVQEFRRPEFEVSAKADPGTCIVGEHANVAVTANYYAGGGLNAADTSWTVSSTPTSYSPPNWSEYSFGAWVPWWSYHPWWGRESSDSSTQTFSSKTDGSGQSTLRLDFPAVNPPRPTLVTTSVSVQDVNRQAWTSSANVLVHPASLYVGLKSERTFVQPGQPLEGSLVVVDLDGKPVAGKSVELTSYRMDWDWVEGSYVSKKADLTVQTVVSGTSPTPYLVKTGDGGTYQIEARVRDSKDRPNESELTQWVAGGKQPPSRNIEQEAVTLIPDKKTYAPGDVAQILVQCPFSPAEVVVSQRRHGLVSQERISLPTGSGTVKVPLTADFLPNLNVQVDAVGAEPRTDDNGKPVKDVAPRPAYATGSLDLAISTASKKLKVAVEPLTKAVEPGADTELHLTITDSAGKPVQGQAVVMLVDDSILALTGYDPADPMGTFFPERLSEVQDSHLREFVQLALAKEMPAPAAPPSMSMMAPAPITSARAMHKSKTEDSAPGGGAAEPTASIRVRSDFNPLAFYAPDVQTDALGKATLKVHMPDNLTRYRVIAVAAAGVDHFGKGESSLTARQPLMVRPSAPRFLNFGDRCELPVVVQNQTDAPLNVSVVARATNAKLEVAGYNLVIPANDRREVRFPCTTEKAGTARFQFAAVSATHADAAEISLPVWTPATTEAFATYGVIDQGAISQPVHTPGAVVKEFGGLQVSTSSTALQELTDAYLYLESYPYECSEQMSSRLLATTALRDVLSAFKGPNTAVAPSVERDLTHLKGLQNDDGGWDYWTRGKPSVPYVSVHVAHALVALHAKGYAVDPAMLSSALAYASTVEQHFPKDYPVECRWAVRAYALNVLKSAGQPNAAKAAALVREAGLDKLSLESLGWILPTLKDSPLAATINRRLDNRVTQTASTAQFDADYGDGDYLILYSSRRTDAVLLDALIQQQPNNPVIPKLVRGLLDHRTAGRWENTQENCFILLALDRYFQRFESVTPDFVARVWLGQRYAGEQVFKGRTTVTDKLDIPMKDLEGTQDLVLSKTGPGRLYYRLGMTYAPASLRLSAADYGFNVSRQYEGVDDPKDVTHDGEGWHIKAGARVRVNLQMVAQDRRYHVALVDPLPAGLETINGELGGSEQPVTRRGRRYSWYRSSWYDHVNLRDERAEAFTSLLYGGVYDYSYLTRATTPGHFVVPPTKAEEMYHPETYGRSATDMVEVK
jgi:uncharacterized protein YfaS (alpha-2-macroglobulin family)